MSDITIIGPGAIGMYLTVLLENAGHNLSLMDYKHDRAERLQQTGLILDNNNQILQAHPRIILKPVFADYIIICVKAYSLPTIFNYKQVLSSTPVLLIQNGISWLKTPEAINGSLSGGVAYMGVTRTCENNVCLAGDSKLLIGNSVRDNNILQPLAELLSRAGQKTQVTQDIKQEAWIKLIVNAAVNPLTVIYNCQNGELLKNEAAYMQLKKLVCEAVTVARSEGLHLDTEDIIARTETTCRQTAENISSMLQDVRHGKKTELQALNGEIINSAERYEIDVSTHKRVVAKLA